MAQGNGYWAKGSKVYEVSIHIEYIIQNPEKFGTTKEKLKAEYKKFKEPFGFEGKARNEIMKNVMSKGWLRIRHNKGRNDHWSIQFDNYKKRAPLIKSFIKKMFMDQINQYDDLVLTGIDDGYYEKISADNFLKEHKEEIYNMVLVKEYHSILSILKDASTNG